MTLKRRQHGTPMMLTKNDGYQQVAPLARVELKSGAASTFQYDEGWLQNLVFEAPSVLPIQDIEPGFENLISACIELPMPSGYADNLLVTPDGQLVLVECKLWRNPESRRKVLTQVMDYAGCFSQWGYEDLEAAFRSGKRPGQDARDLRLWDLVSDASELEERDFIDAVARNLRLGRVLLLIVGDGIDEGIERLASIVQSHAGLHYAIALVELALFHYPKDGAIVVHPRVVARTVNIERGIVRLDDERLLIDAPTQSDGTSGKGRATTLSEEEFFERIALVDASLPARIRAFAQQVQKLGVEIETKRSLIFRWHAVDGSTFNLGYITLAGALSTDLVNWNAKNLGLQDLIQDYVQHLSDAVGGELTHSDNPDNFYVYVVRNDKRVDIGTMLDHADEWLKAIQNFTKSVNEQIAMKNAD